MGKIGIMEIVVILLIVLILFGGGKLAGVGKALGQSIREFKKEVTVDKGEEKAEKKEEQ